jgi:hypothetical protein
MAPATVHLEGVHSAGGREARQFRQAQFMYVWMPEITARICL